MPDVERQKVEALNRISRSIDALTKEVKKLNTATTVYNTFSGHSIKPLDLDSVDHDYTPEDVQKHTPDPV